MAKSASKVKKKPVEKLLADLGTLGWEPGLSEESYELIANAGFRGDSATKSAIICEIALDCKPITLRGLFYRCVSRGLYPSTDAEHYNSIKRLSGRLRKKGLMPYEWIVDSLRSTDKPSSWSGLRDFADTVKESYRKDFWSHLDWYVHVFSEKDAIAGTLSPVTREYDVALSPIRGNTSLSFAHEIGSQWRHIKKPIFVAYLGDFDPNGMDIERDLKAKLAEHSGREIVDFESVEDCELREAFALAASYAGHAIPDEELSSVMQDVFGDRRDLIFWHRLGVNFADFDDFDLIRLPAKKTDSRYKKFAAEFGNDCAEVDALDPNELRRRVREAIEQFIPKEEWRKLREVEEIEKETFNSALANLTEAGQ